VCWSFVDSPQIPGGDVSAGVVRCDVLQGNDQGGIEDERTLRSGLITSQLTGLAFMRYVWRIEPLAANVDHRAVRAQDSPDLSRYSPVRPAPAELANP
jgi:Tetracyclin repressor-like, C-terminal domain